MAMPKAELMEKIACEVRVCVKCRLWEKRQKAVPGEGDINAAVVFVGEAPGYWEDLKGLPFVGAAGKILNTLMTKIGLPRDSVFITNVVKCRPPGNRAPRTDEIKTCTGLYLDRQISLIQPSVIVTLGNHSTVYVLSRIGLEKEAAMGISQLQGKVYTAKFMDLPVLVIPMFHPASVLHNPSYSEALEEDFELLKTKLRTLSLKNQS